MGGQSSGTQTTTTKSDPWSGQQPYLQDLMAQAKNLNAQGPGEYFPGSTVTPFSADTLKGMDAIRDQATAPVPGADAAQAVTETAMAGGQANRNDVLNRAASGGMKNPLLRMLMAGTMAGTTAGLPMMQAAAQGGMDVSPSEITSAANQQTTAGIPLINSSAGANGGVGAIRDAAGKTITAGGETLERAASGADLTGNPLLKQMFDRAAADVRDNTNAAFSMGGRYGSGAHGETLGDSLAGLAANMYGNAWESERGRQMSAASELGSRQATDLARGLQGAESAAGFEESQRGREAQAGSLLSQLQQGDRSAAMSGATTAAGIQSDNAGRRLGAAGNLASLQQTDLARQLSAANSAAGVADSDAGRQLDAANAVNAQGLNTTSQGLQAAGLLPMLRQLGMAGGQDLLSLGGMQEGKNAEQIQDQLNRWNFDQNAGWDNLSKYSGIIGGLGNLGGTTSTAASAPKQNGLLGALSGGTAGAGMASLLGLTGPVGWGLAGLGGLAGLMG